MKIIYIERFFLKWDLCPWSKGWTYWTWVGYYEYDSYSDYPYDELINEYYTQSKKYEIT